MAENITFKNHMQQHMRMRAQNIQDTMSKVS